MATSLYLSGGAAAQTINLLTSNHIRLKRSGWSTRTAASEDVILWETYDLVSKATTAATIIDDLYDIQLFLEDARRYIAKKDLNPCWIYSQAEGGAEVRSLVYDGSLEIIAQEKWGPLLTTDGAVFARLTIAHHKAWERATAVTDSVASLSVFGGVWRPSIAAGDLDGRISQLRFYPTKDEILTKYWIGIKPYQYGGTAFTSKYEAEYGSIYTDATRGTSSLASNGTMVKIDFAGTSEMTTRLACRLEQIIGGGTSDVGGTIQWEDYVGNYVLMGRLEITGTVDVDIYQSLDHKGTAYTVGRELIGQNTLTTGTGYNFYELGHLTIPATGYKNYSGSAELKSLCRTTSWIMEAGVQDSGTLIIDCFFLMPSDLYITADSAFVSPVSGTVAGTLQYLEVTTEPTDEYSIISRVISHATQRDVMPNGYANTLVNWPQNGGLLVYLSEGQNVSSYITGTIAADISVLPRYSFYRES